jgi:hypothetical protein
MYPVMNLVLWINLSGLHGRLNFGKTWGMIKLFRQKYLLTQGGKFVAQHVTLN